jgi:hypothetical protein
VGRFGLYSSVIVNFSRRAVNISTNCIKRTSQLMLMLIQHQMTKVKLALCLAKHYAMKTYRGSGGIALQILNLVTRWK